MCVCPFVRSRLLAPGPDLAPFLVSLVPPPIATARYLRSVYGDRGVHITYIGACPGADDQVIDAHLTPETFLGELAEHGISLAEQPLVFDSIVPPDRRRWCSLPGGVPSAEVLWSDTDTRTLVEIERDDVSTDLAQHIIARDHVLLDLAPSLGCSCSGAIPSLTPRSARVAVTALEPPRALGPVIEPPTAIALDVPVGVADPVEPARPVEPSRPVIAQRTQQEMDHDARERALDMILGGEPEPPVVVAPRRHAPARAEARPPASSPSVARSVEMVMIEPVIARAEQQLASAMSPLVLETLIDEILIEPLIIPEPQAPPAQPPPPRTAAPGDGRVPAQAAGEVQVELDVVREVRSEAASVTVRHEHASASTLTTAGNSVERDARASMVSLEDDRVRLDPVELPDPSDAEASSSDAETLVGLPTQAAPADVAPPFDDDEDFADDGEHVEEDEAAVDAPSGVRRRTPPAMPARHPASAIPKAVSADGRPLPRAYVAKRRVTPPGNLVIPPAVHQVVPEPEQVAADLTPSPVLEVPVKVAETTEPAPTEAAASDPEKITILAPEAEALVMQGAPSEPDPSPRADIDTPAGESVWGVTVEAPVVAKATIAEPIVPAEPIRPSQTAAQVSSESTTEARAGSVAAPAGNGNAMITIIVVALVTLAVSVFFLLGR